MSQISVVVPLYNAERYIRPCIESVLAQTCPDWELIIVDDGSTDDSASIAAEYTRRDDRISLLHHPGHKNLGVSVTRRRAIEESRGQFIALLDADDVFAVNKLERQLTAASEHLDCVVYHGGATGIDSQGKEIVDKSLVDSFNAFAKSSRSYGFRDLPEFLSRNTVLNSSAMIRSDFIRELPYGFPQLFQYEDWTLWVLLSGLGPFHVQSDRLVQYRIHEQSATSRVQKSNLISVYSSIEFLLSTIAFTDDELVREHASRLLADKLSDAVATYSQSDRSNGQTPALRIDPDQLAAAKNRKPKTKWYRKWLPKAA